MQTNFTPEQLSKPDMASSEVELRACLQCNYCINNCPTFQELGDELDSPRGRIFQIKEMLESERTPPVLPGVHVHLSVQCALYAPGGSCPGIYRGEL